MSHRFWVPDAAQGAGVVALPRIEADHASRVLRLHVDDQIRVFDGEGREFAARVVAVDREGVRVLLGEPIAPAPELHTRITLVQSVLKGDKMDDAIRDAVMLGASAIRPLISQRTDVPARAAALRVERWIRISIASTKQCGRAHWTPVYPPLTFDEWLATPRPATTLMLVEPSAAARGRRVRDLPAEPPESACVVVGPEGGWSPEEIERASAGGATLVTLGPRTLRADAVALVALVNLQFLWE